MKNVLAGWLAHRYRAKLLVMVCSGLASLAAAAPSAPPDVARVGQDWSRAWEAKDLGATLALYSDDAVFMNADGSRIVGKAKLSAFLANVLAQYSAHPTLHSLRSETSGQLGYDWGEYTEVIVPLKLPTQTIRTSGTYVMILRKVSGRWLIADQAWTGNVPVPVQK